MEIYRVYSNVGGYMGDITNFDDLVHYIAGTPPTENLTITDLFDNLVVSTFGNFLNRVPDKELLRKIQSSLIPLQMDNEKIRLFNLNNSI